MKRIRRMLGYASALCLPLMLPACAATVGGIDQSDCDPYNAGSSSPYPSLKREIDALLRDKLFPYSTAGVKIISLRSGETIYQNNSRLLMTPASNLKLFTAAAALATLGGDHTVETTVSLGKEGNHELYLKGCGDPLLSGEELRQLSASVRTVTPPAGGYRLVGDVSCFDDQQWGKGWCWDDEPDPDEMYISPLSVNGNAVTVVARPADKPGEPATVTVIPPTSWVTLKNTTRTTGQDSSATLSISRPPGDRANLISVNGTVPLGSPPLVRRVTVWKPEGYALSLFRDALQADGVPVKEIVFGAAPIGGAVIAVRVRSVADLVTVMLRDSNNLAAENLLKLLGRGATLHAGSAEMGVREVRRYLEKRGISTAHQVIVDGSGVSRYNLTNADTIVRLLREMYRDKENFPTFLGSLAVAGKSGTLAHRMGGTRAEGNVKAKSGTLSGVSNLSGYVTAVGGEPLAFSILIQNYAGTAKTAMELQENICILLSGFEPQ